MGLPLVRALGLTVVAPAANTHPDAQRRCGDDGGLCMSGLGGTVKAWQSHSSCQASSGSPAMLLLLLTVVAFPKQQSCTYSFSMKRCTRIPDRPYTGIHLLSMPQPFCGGQMQEGAVLSIFSGFQSSMQESEQTPERIFQNSIYLSKSGCCGEQTEGQVSYRFLPRDVN